MLKAFYTCKETTDKAESGSKCCQGGINLIWRVCTLLLVQGKQRAMRETTIARRGMARQTKRAGTRVRSQESERKEREGKGILVICLICSEKEGTKENVLFAGRNEARVLSKREWRKRDGRYL
jgi:hypothetical protein